MKKEENYAGYFRGMHEYDKQFLRRTRSGASISFFQTLARKNFPKTDMYFAATTSLHRSEFLFFFLYFLGDLKFL